MLDKLPPSWYTIIRKREHPRKRKELKIMRTIRYYVVNKNTGKAIYTNCRHSSCRAFLTTLTDSENYTIGYKWLSI